MSTGILTPDGQATAVPHEVDRTGQGVDHQQVRARLAAMADTDHVEVHASIDSTNRRLGDLVVAGDGVGAVVVAERQTAGRGRRGRTWHDVPDGNVAVSVGVAMPGRRPGLTPLAAALAVRDLCLELALVPSVKWPNDVRLAVDGRPRKVAGILVEAHPDAVPPGAVVGVGVNVDWRGVAPESAGLEGGWTSLAEVRGDDVDRGEVVTVLVAALLERHRELVEDADGILSTYRGVCDTLGQQVQVDLGHETIEGMAVDLDADGALVVDTRGSRRVVTAGDVVHLRGADPLRGDQ